MNMAPYSVILLILLLLSCVGPVDAMIQFPPGELGKTLGNILGSLGSFLTGDGCDFKCKNGAKPIPRQGHVASYNGCGSEEFKLDTALVPWLTVCCNQHDICYDTCNNNRLACDNEFKTCLENICEENQKMLGRLYKNCRRYANILHAGTVTLGCRSYSESQKRACLCPRYQGKYKNTRGGEL